MLFKHHKHVGSGESGMRGHAQAGSVDVGFSDAISPAA
jgi:hypothetical protein